MNGGSPFAREVEEWVKAQQAKIGAALNRIDAGGDRPIDIWTRKGQPGGGATWIRSGGELLERGGVNTSAVWGEFDDAALARMGGTERRFFATGLSLVLHPRSPMVPTVHANLRFFERGSDAWFGGGSDLTPYYPAEEDVRHFHRTWKTVCDKHDPAYYPRFKRACDEYFYLPHRGEMRGVGGIFFDELRTDLEKVFAFVRDCGDAILEAYLPIVQRRRDEPYGERERSFQLYRRGRYVEFNLLYDRGTAFGLATHGRTESIFMSLPPLARWEYDWTPEQGSREAAALAFFQPRDWA